MKQTGNDHRQAPTDAIDATLAAGDEFEARRLLDQMGVERCPLVLAHAKHHALKAVADALRPPAPTVEHVLDTLWLYAGNPTRAAIREWCPDQVARLVAEWGEG